MQYNSEYSISNISLPFTHLQNHPHPAQKLIAHNASIHYIAPASASPMSPLSGPAEIPLHPSPVLSVAVAFSQDHEVSCLQYGWDVWVPCILIGPMVIRLQESNSVGDHRQLTRDDSVSTSHKSIKCCFWEYTACAAHS